MRESTTCGNKKRIWGGRNSKCPEQKGVQHIWGPERGPVRLDQSVWGSQEEHEPGRGRLRRATVTVWSSGWKLNPVTQLSTQGNQGHSEEIIQKKVSGSKKGGSMIAFRWAARGSKWESQGEKVSEEGERGQQRLKPVRGQVRGGLKNAQFSHTAVAGDLGKSWISQKNQNKGTKAYAKRIIFDYYTSIL